MLWGKGLQGRGEIKKRTTRHSIDYEEELYVMKNNHQWGAFHGTMGKLRVWEDLVLG